MNSEQKEQYKKLFRDGFLFDVEKKRFYCKNIESFEAPEGFEEWEKEIFEEKRYYNNRVLEELGITEKENEVLLYKNAKKEGKLIKNKIFTTNKYGDIEIGLYNLNRVPFTFHQTIASHTNIVEKEDVITRYTPWRTQIEGRKYHISGKTGTHPFLHPKIIDAYDNEEDRYIKDRAALKQIKQFTPLSTVKLKPSDFDSGKELGNNIQIIKNIKNKEAGFYLVIAVHTQISKRNTFLEKTVAAGQNNIDFFFDVNTNKYYIYYQKFMN